MSSIAWGEKSLRYLRGQRCVGAPEGFQTFVAPARALSLRTCRPRMRISPVRSAHGEGGDESGDDISLEGGAEGGQGGDAVGAGERRGGADRPATRRRPSLLVARAASGDREGRAARPIRV